MRTIPASRAPAFVIMLLALSAACALADEFPQPDQCMHLLNADLARMLHERSARLGVSAAPAETTWVGYRAGQTGNYWSIGVGPGRPGYDSNGMWTFDTPVHGDSLMGWWPVRGPHRNASGAVRTDEQRPWWAIELGNQANYVINERRDLSDPTAPGNRTFGVIGVWHRDPGNTMTSTIPGTAPIAPSWTPLGGSYSAWMGLRAHGDLTVADPITGTAFNSAVIDYNQRRSASSNVNSRSFPGYGSQMDQMLYRDIDMSGVPAGSAVTVRFTYRTRMSTSKDQTQQTRTGWHVFDPLSQNQVTAGNFISAEAGSPANSLAPVDSFEVYMGAPTVGGRFKSSLYPSDPEGDVDGLRAIYDPQRLWFGEAIQRDRVRQLHGNAGGASGTKTVTLSAADADLFRAAGGGRLRLVFRVHTNRGFDDEGPSYSSNGMGAVQVDDVEVDTNNDGTYELTGSWGSFESTLAIDNDTAIAATDAWKSTGKPPAIQFHAHDLASLPYQDLCGPVGGPNRICNMGGAMISMGNHDRNEAVAGAAGSTEDSGEWAIISPTINLRTAGPSTPNGWDLTGDMAAATEDFYIYYEMYSGIFDVFTTGKMWQYGFQSYPANQANGVPGWGEMTAPGCYFFNPDIQCFQDYEPGYGWGVITTSNPSNRPDSLRIYLSVVSQCYRFGISSGCETTAGAYVDNLALMIVNKPAQAPMFVDIWHWLNDAFPANETAGLPGTAAFDTTSALMKTGLNIAQTEGTQNRPSVPGDSVVVTAVGDSVRVDMVFRIRPGVGNYVTVGDPSSGLRRVPTSPATVTPGDGSFWSVYAADPGAFASPGAAAMHAAAPGSWSALAWNSARIDTVYTNLFPVQGLGIGNPTSGGLWASTYHESEVGVLGVSTGPRASLANPRNRCFMVDPAGAPVAANLTCSSVPGWVTGNPTAVGYNGQPQTWQGTKVIPDGLLTPGAHVQYFFRRQKIGGPSTAFSLCPDTGVVVPQPSEDNLDGHRWQQFGVLPDRWKDPAFGQGGLGMACMLVVDNADRRGDERIWKAVADTIGLTQGARIGSADGYGGVPPGADPNDPTYFIPDRNAQPGSLWDLYGVKAAESLTAPANTIGARLGFVPVLPNLLAGKTTRNSPTLEMLEAYYRLLVVLTGDLNSGILGPFTDRSADDTGMIRNFLLGATPGAERGIMVQGDGFAEYCDGTLAGSPQFTFMTNYLGATLVAPGYLALSSSGGVPFPDLVTTTSVNPNGDIYGVRNSCLATLDVLNLNSGVPEATVASTYQDVGAGAPYIAATFKPAVTARPWIALLNGFRIQDLRGRFGGSSNGRNAYFYFTLLTAFADVCSQLNASLPTLDVPGGGGAAAYVNFMRLLNNPVIANDAVVRFGLARAGWVEIKVFDLAGRRVRTLANRRFEAGEHTVVWDGRDDRGARAPRGVYFTQALYPEDGFEAARKLTLLR